MAHRRPNHIQVSAVRPVVMPEDIQTFTVSPLHHVGTFALLVQNSKIPQFESLSRTSWEGRETLVCNNLPSEA